jgi:hypothetical protein
MFNQIKKFMKKVLLISILSILFSNIFAQKAFNGFSGEIKPGVLITENITTNILVGASFNYYHNSLALQGSFAHSVNVGDFILLDLPFETSDNFSLQVGKLWDFNKSRIILKTGISNSMGIHKGDYVGDSGDLINVIDVYVPITYNTYGIPVTFSYKKIKSNFFAFGVDVGIDFNKDYSFFFQKISFEFGKLKPRKPKIEMEF